MKYLILEIILFFTSTMYIWSQDMAISRAPYQIDSQKVAPGLTYFHYRSDSLNRSPFSIHVLQMHLDSVYLKSALAMDQITGQETTSSMVQRKGALAGINGGFSYSNDPWNLYHGDPKDFFVFEGKILSEPLSTRSSLGFTSPSDSIQHVFLNRFTLNLNVRIANKTSLKIHGINRKIRENELILYTPEWGKTSLTSNRESELIIQGDSLRGFVSIKGSSVIPDEGNVLSASGIYRDSLKSFFLQGQQERIALDFDLSQEFSCFPKPLMKRSSIHTAGPILIWKGKQVERQEIEQIPESFVITRHPRTVVGISESRRLVWFVVVDGRQPKLSVGMTLPEISVFLLKLGAYEGYNLDGGGSSTMVIGKQIVNSPSDPKERRRCDAILVFSRFSN